MIHLIAEHLIDLSDLLRSVGGRNEPLPVHTVEGTRRRTGAFRIRGAADRLGRKPRDVYMPDLRLGSGIKVLTRNFKVNDRFPAVSRGSHPIFSCYSHGGHLIYREFFAW